MAIWQGIATAATSIQEQGEQRAQLKAVQKENERQNKLTWQGMAQQINTVNLQRGWLRQQTGTDNFNIDREAKRAAGSSTASAAAAGIEGASVNEATRQIAGQSQQAIAQSKSNELLQEVNLDTSVQDIVQTAVNSQRYSQKPKNWTQIVGKAGFDGFVAMLGAHAQNQQQWGASGANNSGTTAPVRTNTGTNAGTALSSYSMSNQLFNNNGYSGNNYSMYGR